MHLDALIAEDEPLLRQALVAQLQRLWPELRIVAECEDGAAALEALETLKPDLAFLDIRMPGVTGIDVARALETLSPQTQVVFITAYDQYAIDAFEQGAMDYLLKPVGPGRLAQTLARLMPYSTLDLRTSKGKRYIRPHDVSLLQAQGDYVMLHSSVHGNELVHTTLKTLAEQLPSPPFCVLSRSVIINLGHIAHVATQPGEGTHVAFVNDVRPVLLGRAATQRLRQALAVPEKPAPGRVQNGTTILSETP